MPGFMPVSLQDFLHCRQPAVQTAAKERIKHLGCLPSSPSGLLFDRGTINIAQ